MTIEADLAAYAGALLLTGAIGGFAAGLLGVGGGIVIVPVLYHVLTALDAAPEVRMHVAVGTSLASIIATSAVSFRAHRARGAVDEALVKRWAPALVFGVVAASFVAAEVDSRALAAVFGLVALAVAAHFTFGRPDRRLADDLPGPWAQRAMAGVVGGLSTLMGIGGGTLSGPLLSLFNYPMHRAVGTASALGLLIGAPGAVGFVIAGWGRTDLPPVSLGYVNLLGLALILPTSMLLAPLGARVAHALPAATLKRVFAAFLALTGLKMLIG